MAITRKERVKAAILDIRHFHKIGQTSVENSAGRAKYGENKFGGEAETLKLDRFTLYRARQFARGYTEEKLDDLCGEIEKQSDGDGAIFGKSHLIRSLAVPESKRASLQAKAIQKGWTLHRLSAEIAERFGRRRIGGKRPKIPDRLIGVYEQIESRCNSWRRWKQDLFRLLEGPKTPKDSIAHMDDDIIALLESVTESMDQLRANVSAELNEARPKRELAKPKKD